MRQVPVFAYKDLTTLLLDALITMSIIEPDASQGTALYNCRGQTLKSWGKYGQNIQA